VKKLLLAVGLPFVLAACVTGASGASGLASGYWSKTAGETTCAEWLKQMTPDQQSGLAKGAVLAIVKNDVDNAVQVPGDSDSADFAKKISGSCDALGGDRRVSDIATLNLMIPLGNPLNERSSETPTSS
jgi:hypothetical protein